MKNSGNSNFVIFRCPVKNNMLTNFKAKNSLVHFMIIFTNDFFVGQFLTRIKKHKIIFVSLFF